MIVLEGLADMRARLEQLEPEAAALRGLAAGGAHVAAVVRAALSNPPGGPHAAPWLRTGALRDSIAVVEREDAVLVASTSDVAVHQELGTRHVPPRPFLAPAAIGAVDAVAAMVATEVQAELQRGAGVA